MFKKARLKNITRTITGTLNRFLAISAIVALGAGFLGGLEATTPDMKDAADSYMDKYNLYHLDVVNRLGFTEEQIRMIAGTEGVEYAHKAILQDEVFVDSQNKRYTMRVFGMLPENGEMELNGYELLDGTVPQSSDQCLVQITSTYSASAPKVGEVLTVTEDGGAGFSSSSLTVSGIIKSPMFISAEMEPSTKGSGFLDMAIYVRPDFFVMENYNHVFVTVKGARDMDTWSKEYKNLTSEVSARIDNALRDQVYDQFDSMIDYAGNLDDVIAKAVAADRNLRLAEGEQAARHEEVLKIISGGKNPDVALVEGLKKEIELNENPIKDYLAYDIEVGSLSESIVKIQSLRSSVFSVEDRSQNSGYSGYKDNIEKISSLSKVFPVFFFFIALLVSLTTMTRLVEEKRNEIGTLKSLGFSSFQLLGQYLLYALLSSILGCAVGLVVGFKLFPAAVSFAYGMMYSVPLGQLPFRWNIALPVSGIAIGVILVATAAACFSETLSEPAGLMAPKAPAPGKRIFLERIGFIWNRLNFSRKVTVRNMFRYKRRLWMTIAGVAGCSALLVAGFGLRDSLQDIISIQFNQIDTYNITVLFNSPKAYDQDQVVRDFLDDRSTVKEWLKVSGESVTCRNGDKLLAFTMYVPEDVDSMRDFINLRTRKGHRPIDLEQDGIVMNEKQTELLGIRPGDFVELENNSGVKRQVKVVAAAENYLYNNIYATPSEYEKLFGQTPEYNAALCRLVPEKNNKATVSKIMESPSVMYAMWIDSLLANAHKTIDSINIVVVVIIFTSGLLSLIVLYNLTNINICERKREIATLLVLGYTEKEARKYIFREINVLSVLGAAAGLFLGGPLHAIVVHATEVNVVMWGRTVHPLSYVYAFLVSILFTVVVNLIMKKSITKIDMVESLKSKD